MRASGAEYKID